MTSRRKNTSIVFNGTNNQIHHLPLDEVWVNAVVVDGKHSDPAIFQVFAVTGNQRSMLFD